MTCRHALKLGSGILYLIVHSFLGGKPYVLGLKLLRGHSLALEGFLSPPAPCMLPSSFTSHSHSRACSDASQAPRHTAMEVGCPWGQGATQRAPPKCPVLGQTLQQCWQLVCS